MCICNDRRWPETFRVMGLKGAEMVVLGYKKPAHAYGVSKLVVEDIARGFAVQGAISITCLRPVAVVVESNLQRAVDRAADPGHRWLASYVTGEDTGRAFAAALEYGAAFDALLIAADDSASEVPTLERLAGVFGAAPKVRDPG